MAGNTTPPKITVTPPPQRAKFFQLRITDDDLTDFAHLAAEDGYLSETGRGVSTWAVEILRAVVKGRRGANDAKPKPQRARAPAKKRAARSKRGR